MNSHEPAQVETRFSAEDVAGFEADDISAGRAIGKLLSILFIYTVIAMSIVAFWTAAKSPNSGRSSGGLEPAAPADPGH